MNRKGITLVELLIVFGIIAALLAMLLPAVQFSRERSRAVVCQANLHQIAVASLAHEDSHHHLPTGGWGWGWVGDPDLGFSRNQPGGWPYALLPFLEQVALRERGAGLPEAAKREEVRLVTELPLAVFTCPSRRSAVPIPYVQVNGFFNIDRPRLVASCDYAANVGDLRPTLYGPGPATLATGNGPNYAWTQTDRTGVVYRRSETRSGDLTDGRFATYLIGEKYVAVEHYHSGRGTNDDQGLYVGYDRDTLRCTHPEHAPYRDRLREYHDHSFGSAHPGGFAAAFCDGSVRMVRFTISAEVHRRLGNRRDGQPVAIEAF
jgi:prepilin-type processing-associated H-X9-DG protein